jgi:putative ABC transport system substrate-binding protein
MVGAGLAASLPRPGGNTTGVSLLASELDGKRQEILFELLPAARQMAVLADSLTTPSAKLELLREAAHARAVELSIYRVERSQDVTLTVVAAKAAGADALNVLASPLLHGERQAIIQGTADSQLPAIYQWPSTVQEGALLGYGPRFSEFYFQWARQLSKVLRGTKPADLPIEQPTKYELAINLKTAKALGLEIPPTVLARADEVIE